MIDSSDANGKGGGGGRGKLKRWRAICRLSLSLSSIHYSLKYASIYQGAKERVYLASLARRDVGKRREEEKTVKFVRI